MSRLPLLAALTISAAILAGCPGQHRPGPYDPHLDVADDAPLPEGEAALLAEADRAAARGPDAAFMGRSLRCANAVLADQPAHVPAAWRAARALYFLSTQAEEKSARADLSARCMDVAAVATRGEGSARGHYYAALCMGARAQSKNLEAIGLLPKMVESGKRALALDATIVHGGPDRLLGGIYLRAPAWPTSVGDIDEALTHLEQAIERAPDWAENHLLYAEALAEDERTDEAKAALQRARTLMARPDQAPWQALWSKDAAKLEKALADE